MRFSPVFVVLLELWAQDICSSLEFEDQETRKGNWILSQQIPSFILSVQAHNPAHIMLCVCVYESQCLLYMLGVRIS